MAHPFPPVQPSSSLPPPIPSSPYHHSHRHGGALERGWIPLSCYAQTCGRHTSRGPL